MFVGDIFKRVKSPNFFGGEIIESRKKIFCAKKDLEILMTKSKIHLAGGATGLIIRTRDASAPKNVRGGDTKSINTDTWTLTY